MKKPDFIIGIDPGASQGGLVVMNSLHDVTEAIRFSKIDWEGFSKTIGWYALNNRFAACIEEVHTMPSDGVASAGKFMKAYGFILGCLTACEIPITYVQPQVWQRAMALGTVHGNRKKAHQQKANALFPHCMQNYHGNKIPLEIADAFLIAEYMWRKTYTIQ